MTLQEKEIIKKALINDYVIIRQEELRLHHELKLLRKKSKSIRRYLSKIDKHCRNIFREMSFLRKSHRL